MLSNEETVEWLIKNRTDEDGVTNLNGLDFGDEAISLRMIKARVINNSNQKAWIIYNVEQEAKECVNNESQKACRIYNSSQEVTGWLDNTKQKSENWISNNKQKAKKKIKNENQEAIKIFN